MHYLLLYDVVPDFLERHMALRREHVAHARAAEGRGDLVLEGVLAEPTDHALLLLEASSRDAVEAFARTDPYVREGLVRKWGVRRWTPLDGGAAYQRLAEPEPAVTRVWHESVYAAHAAARHRWLAESVIPRYRGARGCRDALLLRRAHEGRTHFVLVTSWDSEAASLANPDPLPVTADAPAPAAVAVAG